MFHYRGTFRPTQRPFGKGAEQVYRRMLNEGLLCPIEPLPQQIMNRFHDLIVTVFDSIVRRALLPFLLRTTDSWFLASIGYEY
jgi:hypothetical protein